MTVVTTNAARRGGDGSTADGAEHFATHAAPESAQEPDARTWQAAAPRFVVTESTIWTIVGRACAPPWSRIRELAMVPGLSTNAPAKSRRQRRSPICAIMGNSIAVESKPHPSARLRSFPAVLGTRRAGAAGAPLARTAGSTAERATGRVGHWSRQYDPAVIAGMTRTHYGLTRCNFGSSGVGLPYASSRP